MNATYRCRASFYFASVLCLAVSAGMAVVCPFAVRDAGESSKLPAGIGTGALSAVFFVLAAAVARFIRRHQLTLTDMHVEAIGVWGTKRIALDEVVRLRWMRMGEKGAISIAAPGGKLTIDVGNYAPADLREMIRFFRRRLPESVQEGWKTFWPNYYHLFDDPDPAQREVAAAATGALRWRLFAWCLAGTLLAGPVGFAVWSQTGDAAALPLLAALLVPWAVIPFARVNRGRLREKHGVGLRANPPIVAAFTIFLLSWLVWLPLAFCGYDGLWILPGGILLAFALLALGLAVQAKRFARARQAAAGEAEQLYLGGSARDAGVKGTRR